MIDISLIVPAGYNAGELSDSLVGAVILGAKITSSSKINENKIKVRVNLFKNDIENLKQITLLSLSKKVSCPRKMTIVGVEKVNENSFIRIFT